MRSKDTEYKLCSPGSVVRTTEKAVLINFTPQQVPGETKWIPLSLLSDESRAYVEAPENKHTTLELEVSEWFCDKENIP